ncbi:tyrosine--tRNA ligase [Candidatus Falkowbacteria bacterium CG10_big_fil_rev_8_21_14_0_10_39_9]|uniref:Tyrosine--tRNA ligase n=1 Tax=Candidatus Falkowbacteria bacterium CG10_big_fil_rev_8_21_14_0_10_39_9 TaxID=1974566 RepID=A0A2M6WPX9_9BACT|nr:MAG: tyrosine--tRNA ligase [Candidatus Falkowbacteria bacterium CG10_big_fil_rev_8_21_14_0_10_39_9]
MAKVITDKKLVDELLSRGVEKIYPSRELLEKRLLSGEKIRLYCGYDPSATSLHVGNAISINKLAQFQKLGHEVIFLLGDFTGMIGDPTDKKAARKKLTREEVLENAREYQSQASAYLDFDGDNPAQVLYNSAWNDKLNFKDIIELSSNFTVQQMIQRDMFQERLKEAKPIYLHEFLYPLTQAYDSVAMDVDLEIGGNDQMFNMMCGRDLMKTLKNKEKFVLTLKLLADDAGKKMGKSEGNAVFLNATPNDMYGIIMSWPDGSIALAFELCTNIPYEEMKQIASDLKSAKANPRDLKMKLALEITKINHGTKLALEAQENFIKTIQNKEMPDEIPSYQTKSKNINIVELLLESKMVTSKGEARRLMEQGGIKIKTGTTDFVVIKDTNLTLDLKEEIIIQRGKRQYLRITK